MKTKIASILLAGLALGGCSGNSSSEEVAGGGFETSDLHGDLNAVVVDSTGAVLAGARVWAVGAGVDSASQGAALDSAIAGFAGEVVLRPGEQVPYGIEAWLGDTLAGFVPLVDPSRRDTVRVVLRPTRFTFLPCSSFALGQIQFLGSHFVQAAPQTCRDSFLVVVPAASKARVVWAGGDSVWTQPLPLRWDSLPQWHGVPGMPQFPGAGAGGGSGAGNGSGGGQGANPAPRPDSAALAPAPEAAQENPPASP